MLARPYWLGAMPITKESGNGSRSKSGILNCGLNIGKHNKLPEAPLLGQLPEYIVAKVVQSAMTLQLFSTVFEQGHAVPYRGQSLEFCHLPCVVFRPKTALFMSG